MPCWTKWAAPAVLMALVWEEADTGVVPVTVVAGVVDCKVAVATVPFVAVVIVPLPVATTTTLLLGADDGVGVLLLAQLATLGRVTPTESQIWSAN